MAYFVKSIEKNNEPINLDLVQRIDKHYNEIEFIGIERKGSYNGRVYYTWKYSSYKKRDEDYEKIINNNF